MISKVIPLYNWLYRMDDKKKAFYQNSDTTLVDGFGYKHKASVHVWRSVLEVGYIRRMNRALDLFDIPKGCNVVADVGCGPWAGIFYIRKWEHMYAVDPSWQMYEEKKVVRLTCKKSLKLIEDYAQFFQLPQKADLIFSINALNHGGDLKKSIDNIMSNLKIGGLFFMHLHLRTGESVDGGHPMMVSEEGILQIISQYKIVNSKIFDFDPVRKKGHKSIVATLQRE